MLVAWVCYFYEQKLSKPICLGGRGWGRREEWGVPVAYNTKIINAIEMKFGWVVDSHKTNNLVK